MVDVWEEMFGIDIEEGPQIGLVDISEVVKYIIVRKLWFTRFKYGKLHGDYFREGFLLGIFI